MTKGKSEEKRRSFVSLNTLVRCHGTIVLLLLLLLLLPAKAAAADSPPMAPPGNPYTLNNGALNPSMAIIVVVLIGAFFFMGFLSIYIRQCAGEAAETIQQPNNGRRRSSGRGGPRGLDQTIIETFPTFMYSVVKGLKLGKGNLECAVCLSEFQDDENLRLLPKCDHVFHPECIDAWLASHTTCPVCRADLHPPDPAAEPLADPEEEEEEEENGVITADDVSITIEDEHNPPILHREGSSRILQESIKNRPARTGGSSFRWSRFKGSKYPRSHSTGHSLVQTENYDRYTLRLPENIRKQIVRGKLNRTISCVAFPTEGGSVSGSSHGGYKAGEGSSRGKSLRYGRIETVVKSDRWVFPKALLRSFSKAKGGREVALAASADGEDSTSSREKPIVGQPFLPSYLRTSFDSCLGGKPEQSTPVPVLSSQSSAPAPVPAPS